MEWLLRGWDGPEVMALVAGLDSGLVLVVFEFGAWAEIAGAFCAVLARWAMWQIPPPGRSRARGRPAEGFSQLVRLAVLVLLATLSLEIVLSPVR